MPTDFKVNKVFFFHLYCYPALVSFIRTQSGESIWQSEKAPWCMSLYTKKFGKALKFIVQFPQREVFKEEIHFCAEHFSVTSQPGLTFHLQPGQPAVDQTP